MGEDCCEALYAAIESRQVRPGLCANAGLKLVYSPLNGSGLVPVMRVLGISASRILPLCPSKGPGRQFPHLPLPEPRNF